jgi:hypothetical protein
MQNVMPTVDNGIGFYGVLDIKAFKKGEMIRSAGPFKNKVVSSNGYGRNLILRALAGDATFPVIIDSARLGDYNVAPGDADLMLGGTLVSDIPITNMTVVNNVLTVDVFVADANLPADTYEEMGFFMSGRMLSRILISPAYTKASGEDTLFTYTLTATG